jgi:hypothetical protein
MKIKLSIILLIFINVTFAQKRKNVRFLSAGAIPPFSTKYQDYLTFSAKFMYTPKLKAFYEAEKLPFDPNGFVEKALWISGGLKQVPNGDFKVLYEVEDFQFIDYVEIDDEKAMVVGLKANLQVFDKEDQLIFSRYLAPISKAYFYNKDKRLDANLNTLLEYTFDKMIKEFNYMFTYGPFFDTNVITLTDTKDLGELVEFENSVQVFEALKNLKRSEQPAVLDGVIEYWKPFLKYNKIKDKERGMDLRLAANYNTAMALIMQNKLAEAEKLLATVKANDRTLLGMGWRDMELRGLIKKIKDYQTLSKEFKMIDPIEEPNATKDYQYEAMTFKNASVVYDKDEQVTGNVKLLFNNPVSETLPDFQQYEEVLSNDPTRGAMQLAGALMKKRRDAKPEDSKVIVEIVGKKKPKKIDLKDIVSIKTEAGESYSIQIMGFDDAKRYAAVKELMTCPKVTLYQEIFPGNEMLFKKVGLENALQLKAFETDKKAFKTYFRDCAKMHPAIDAGEYANASQKSYIKFMEEYIKICCQPLKKR